MSRIIDNPPPKWGELTRGQKIFYVIVYAVCAAVVMYVSWVHIAAVRDEALRLLAEGKPLTL